MTARSSETPWDLFEARLAEVLHRLAQREDITCLIVSVKEEPEAYTQYMCSEGGLLAEASSFRFARRRGMPRDVRKALRHQAKQEAQQLRAAGWTKPKSRLPNWSHVPKGDTWEAGQTAARMSVATLSGVYRVPMPGDLTYRAFVQGSWETLVLKELGIDQKPEPVVTESQA